jgi:hypothetical protein
MASGTLRLVHSATGEVKEAPVGFSWTNLFFGFFVPLFRGHLLNAVGQVILACMTMGLTLLIVPFFYNKMYIDYLVKHGYINPLVASPPGQTPQINITNVTARDVTQTVDETQNVVI